MNTESHTVSFSQLCKLEVERPEGAGSLWQPIAHSKMVSAFAKAAEAHGLQIESSTYIVSKDHQDLRADFVIKNDKDEGASPVLSLVTSNARRRSTKLFMGYRTDHYELGHCVIMLSEIEIGRKREKKFNLELRLNAAVQVFVATRDSLSSELLEIEEADSIPTDQYNEVLLELARNGVVPYSRLSIVEAYSDAMQSPEFFLCAVCKAVEKGPAIDQPAKLLRARTIMGVTLL